MLNSKSQCWAAFLFLLCLVVSSAKAVTIESTGSQYEPGGVRYYFTITSFDVGGDHFCDDMSAVICNLSIRGLMGPGNVTSSVFSDYYWSRLTPTTDMWDLYWQMRRQNGFKTPFQGNLFVPNGTPITDSFCISFAQTFSYSDAGGFLHPVGPCAPVVKPALKCEIKGNTIINHNNVSDAAVEGNEAAVTVQLTCTGLTSVIASASKEFASGVKLRADGSLYSKLTIDGKAAADGVAIKVEEGFPPLFSLSQR